MHRFSEIGSMTSTPWQDVVKLALDVDITQDIPDVHPPTFCPNCRHKLARFVNKLACYNQVGGQKPVCSKEKTKIVQWEPHGESCIACSLVKKFKTGGGRPKKPNRGRRQKSLTLPSSSPSSPSTTSDPSVAFTSSTSSSPTRLESPLKRPVSATYQDWKEEEEEEEVRKKQRTEKRDGVLLCNKLENEIGPPKRSSRISRSKISDQADATSISRASSSPKRNQNLVNNGGADTNMHPRFPKTLAVTQNGAQSELVCTICEGFLDDPIRVAPCAHNLCRHCICKHLMEFGAVCPSCDEQLNGISGPDPAIVRILNNWMVNCHNYDKGCEVVISLDQVWDHYRDCPYLKVIPPLAPLPTVHCKMENDLW